MVVLGPSTLGYRCGNSITYYIHADTMRTLNSDIANTTVGPANAGDLFFLEYVCEKSGHLTTSESNHVKNLCTHTHFMCMSKHRKYSERYQQWRKAQLAHRLALAAQLPQ